MRDAFTGDKNPELDVMDLIRTCVKSMSTILQNQASTITWIHRNNHINTIKTKIKPCKLNNKKRKYCANQKCCLGIPLITVHWGQNVTIFNVLSY